MLDQFSCDICRGSGTVLLPIYRQMRVVPDTRKTEREDTARSYPCPECSRYIPQQRVAVVQFLSLVHTGIQEPESLAAVRKEAAHGLVEELLKAGLISFERGPDDTVRCTFPVRATVGVVSSTDVASLEQRVAARQEEFAQDVIRTAARKIRYWGAEFYGEEGPIGKSQAIDELFAALKNGRTRQPWRKYEP